MKLKTVKEFNRGNSTVSFYKPNLEMTTLVNGLRVVTNLTPGHFTALGAYVDAGARYENPDAPGLSHIVDRMSWKSTDNVTGTQMLENLNQVGGNYMCSAQRELILYQASVFNPDVEKMFECMAETVRCPKVLDQELYETLQTCAYEVQDIGYKADMFLPEVLHAAAYNHNTLGNPLFCPPDRIPEVTREDILGYHKKFYQPQNTIIAMVGIEHSKALQIVSSQLGDWEGKSSSRPSLGEVKYSGGELCLPYQPPISSNLPELVHMQIAFETKGLLDNELYALATLQKLLGGGSSFSAGGPGKGMFSRLYTQVLNRYGFVENCMAFNHAYIGSGLFGISISCSPDAAHVTSQIIGYELSKLLETNPDKGALNEKEVARAKNQLISSLLMNLESKLAELEDLGRQIQSQGKLTLIDEMISKIERLTPADLRNVAEKVLTGNTVNKGISTGLPTVVMQGDRERFGDVEFIMRHFGLGKYPGPQLEEPREYTAEGKPKKEGWFS
ncbi:Mitochondrial-processing peptidase subunit alpha [Scheffersomyces spartinae]|uniref:Alpha-MPP n=1 Tax=Scheffersomyces spartinae TaxID=45513 RepID=A0A9P8AKS9_9ASCO|nr:Mitochondrial-processing peptidase subunit alpha [Scheffersomyces spartinae]KAG7196143.1 Mitochondrial-processing peptidase subunit alpha [Scheffersomyces spartinae]